MNILIFNDSFYELSETFIFNQVQALKAKHNIFYASFSIKNTEKFKDASLTENSILLPLVPKGIADRILNKAKRSLSTNKISLTIAAQRKLKNFILDNKIDTIHAHFGVNGVKVLPLVQALKLKLIVSFHGYDASKLLRNQQYGLELQKLFNTSSKIVLCADFMFKNLEKFGLKKRNTTVIPYGVNVQQIKQINPVENEGITIIHAGRIVPKKGVPDLLSVIIELKDKHKDFNFQFKIIGDGIEAPLLQNIIDRENASLYVKLLGSKKHSDLIAEVKGAGIFVLNSRLDNEGDSEGLPNSILEAMACKTTVVSTKHAGIPQMINSGKNGLLADEKNNKELFNSIEKLLLNANYRTELAEQAYVDVSTKFSLENMNNSLEQLFEN